MSNAMSNPEYESWLQVSAGAADSSALQLCPFCGGKAAFVPRAVNLALQKDPSDPKFGVSVICGKCGAESANYLNEEYAGTAWNRRASPSVNEEKTEAAGGVGSSQPERFTDQAKPRQCWAVEMGWERKACETPCAMKKCNPAGVLGMGQHTNGEHTPMDCGTPSTPLDGEKR